MVTLRSRDGSKTAKSLKKKSHTTVGDDSGRLEPWSSLCEHTVQTLVMAGESLPSNCLLLCSLCEFCFNFPTHMNFVDFMHLMILPPLPGGNVSTWNCLTSKEPSKGMECFHYEETAIPHEKMKKGLVGD